MSILLRINQSVSTYTKYCFYPKLILIPKIRNLNHTSTNLMLVIHIAPSLTLSHAHTYARTALTQASFTRTARSSRALLAHASLLAVYYKPPTTPCLPPPLACNLIHELYVSHSWSVTNAEYW